MAIVADIVDSCLCIPQYRSLHIRHLTVKRHLRCLLVYLRITLVRSLSRTFHVLTDDERTSRCILVPPLDKGVIISSTITNLPVDLRHAVVEPAIIHPHQHVGIEIVVILCTVGVTANIGVVPVAIDAER